MTVEIFTDYAKVAKAERKPHGSVVVDGREVAHTLQCPHCGGHFISFRGSRIRRAFCVNCMAVTCGNPQCDPCLPTEELLRRMEGGQ